MNSLHRRVWIVYIKVFSCQLQLKRHVLRLSRSEHRREKTRFVILISTIKAKGLQGFDEELGSVDVERVCRASWTFKNREQALFPNSFHFLSNDCSFLSTMWRDTTDLQLHKGMRWWHQSTLDNIWQCPNIIIDRKTDMDGHKQS